ncbi:MAG: bifunctional UDP-N-acetylglucosamine diphosphorylase/glucosamine-1-phosphate N-acetyltransferase GlmU [Candidatus Caldatribacterium sp.]|nr:bifunctional UDP-N-acetylglucosamine diphosphorylase/glucosamine-1-phosphate N-acetyltransferase GlmU [Candidatus Caldatribacterium sp.]
MQTWALVVLAAGLGKRMRSPLPKIFFPALGKPLVAYLIASGASLGFGPLFLVVSPSVLERARELFGESVTVVPQEAPLGTGDAARTVLPFLPESIENLLIVYADMPLLSQETLKKLCTFLEETHSDLVFATSFSSDPSGFGRVVREGERIRIVEEKDCSPEERAIQEVNIGIFALRKSLAQELLPLLENRNAQGEFYLTDLVALAQEQGYRVAPCAFPWSEEFTNVNTPSDFARVLEILRERKLEELFSLGVKILDPRSVYIDWDVTVGEDVWVYPGVIVEGKSVIAPHVHLGPFTRIVESTIGERSVVTYSVVEYSRLAEDVQVGPFAHLRPGTELARGVRIGNFVEVKNSVVGEGTKALHLSYLGDATIGKAVNIGAGTITCNFDGKKKNPTFIEDGVFIGSNNALVAPVRIGRGAYTAAGSTITRDVPPYALGLGRARQVNIEGWARRKLEEG